MKDTFYITTAIDYPNAAPHIGHAYEKILADALARYHRLRGKDVYFLTGVDQHGQKVAQAAAKEGMPTRDFALRNTEKFLSDYRHFEVSFDAWAATTDPRHIRAVQAAQQRLFDCGQIYKGAYEGHYSVRQEQFLTDKERGADGEFGPEWGEVVFLREENYYFKLGEHRDWLVNFIATHPDFITPAWRAADALNAAEKITGDLCISRPKSRLDWGIELPFDRDYVTYVWFDALLNYVTFAGWLAGEVNPGEAGLPDFARLWPANWQVIGKDILVPAHGIYWPIMLHALGFPDDAMPHLLVHGWWNVRGEKMSKSLGNVVSPDAIAERFGVPALRYYLLRDITTGADADFILDRVVSRYNSDLANGLGNLLNRKLTMTRRYREGRIRRGRTEADEITRVREIAEVAVQDYRRAMDAALPHAALEALWAIVTVANALVDSSQPFKLAKLTDDPAAQERLDAVLYALAEALRIVGLLLAPALPEAADAILAQLNVPVPPAGEDRLPLCVWGGLVDGHQLGEPKPLFPRIEVPAES